ncbi:MAG: DUF4368 domain-containing protein, partial [Firmicutes bacterium]|nr:DUF4368 domain-containing protein [Bacillota bacterium]
VLTVIQKFIDMAVDMDALIWQINAAPQRNILSNRIKQAILSNEREKDRIGRLIMDLYPDYKDGLLSKDQYFALKEKYDSQAINIDNTLVKLREKQEKEKDGITGINLFVCNFKKYKNIGSLTREVLVELVNNIYVHEGGGLEIDFRFKDAYEQALEYIGANRMLVEKLPEIIAQPVALPFSQKEIVI